MLRELRLGPQQKDGLAGPWGADQAAVRACGGNGTAAVQRRKEDANRRAGVGAECFGCRCGAGARGKRQSGVQVAAGVPGGRMGQQGTAVQLVPVTLRPAEAEPAPAEAESVAVAMSAAAQGRDRLVSGGVIQLQLGKARYASRAVRIQRRCASCWRLCRDDRSSGRSAHLLAAGTTDLRRGFTGLSALVQTALEQDPFSGHVLSSAVGA